MRIYQAIKTQWIYSFRQMQERDADDIADKRERIGDFLTAATRWVVGSNLVVPDKYKFVSTRIQNSDIERNFLIRAINKIVRKVLFAAFLPLHLTGMIFYKLSSTRRANCWSGDQVKIVNTRFSTAFAGLTDNDIKELFRQMKSRPDVMLNPGDTVSLTNGTNNTDRSLYINSSIRVCGSGKIYFLRRIPKDTEMGKSGEPEAIVVTLPGHLKKKVSSFPKLSLTQVAAALVDSEDVKNPSPEKILVGPPTNSINQNDAWHRIGPYVGTQRQRETDKRLWDVLSTKNMVATTLEKTANHFKWTLPESALKDIDENSLDELLKNILAQFPNNPKKTTMSLKIPKNGPTQNEEWILRMGNYELSIPRSGSAFDYFKQDFKQEIAHVLNMATLYSEDASTFFKPITNG